MSDIITIYIQLMDEPAARPTEAINLGNGLYKILPTADYGTAEEIWEFPPNSVTRGEERQGITGKYILAVAKEQFDGAP